MDEKALLDYCNKYEKVVCYGAGLYGKITRVFLHEHGIDIDAFVVSNVSNECKCVLEKELYGISEYSFDERKCGILLCANNIIRPDMEHQLEEMTIRDYFIVDTDLINLLDMQNKYDRVYRYNGVKTLLYHRVDELKSDIWGLAVTPYVFEKNIEYLNQNYKIVRFEDDWHKYKENAICITFDDGYVDNYENALPVLEKYEVPATVFICTGNIGSDDEFCWDKLENVLICNNIERKELVLFGKKIILTNMDDRIKACYSIREKLLTMESDDRNNYMNELMKKMDYNYVPRPGYRTMNETEIKKMSQSKCIAIGGHTVTHSVLAVESREQQYWEIKESKQRLEEIIDKPIKVFSYPFGSKQDYNIDTINIAKKNGYKKIAAVELRYRERKLYNYNIPRLGFRQSTGVDCCWNLRRTICLG